MNVLFVCNLGQNRSATARDLWKHARPDDATRAIGALTASPAQLKDAALWADMIMVVEEHQAVRLREYARPETRIVNLEIENAYPYGDPLLQEEIRKKLEERGLL